MSAENEKPLLRHITATRIILAMLICEGLCWLATRAGWFTSDLRKGASVLNAMACIGIASAVVYLWCSCALLARKRFECNIRCLIILAIVFVFPLTWMASDILAARKQHSLVRSVQRAGGSITYDFERTDGIAMHCPRLGHHGSTSRWGSIRSWM